MNLQLAEQQLREAQAEEAERARDTLRKQLADIRARLREAQADYSSLSKRIHAGERGVALIQAQIDELTGELTTSMKRRPEVADALPNDPEAADWRREHTRLEAARDKLIVKRLKLQATIPPRMQAAKYEGELGRIARLELSQHNLVRKLNGESIGQSWQGGVYRVL